jgi:hypothetical protein
MTAELRKRCEELICVLCIRIGGQCAAQHSARAAVAAAAERREGRCAAIGRGEGRRLRLREQREREDDRPNGDEPRYVHCWTLSAVESGMRTAASRPRATALHAASRHGAHSASCVTYQRTVGVTPNMLFSMSLSLLRRACYAFCCLLCVSCPVSCGRGSFASQRPQQQAAAAAAAESSRAARQHKTKRTKREGVCKRWTVARARGMRLPDHCVSADSEQTRTPDRQKANRRARQTRAKKGTNRMQLVVWDDCAFEERSLCVARRTEGPPAILCALRPWLTFFHCRSVCPSSHSPSICVGLIFRRDV